LFKKSARIFAPCVSSVNGIDLTIRILSFTVTAPFFPLMSESGDSPCGDSYFEYATQQNFPFSLSFCISVVVFF
jgi:hypothetical protein